MKLVILDRDGVINYDSDNYIKSPQEWQPIPGSLEAIACLKQAGFTVAVASNQSGIARGYYSHQDLADIHQKMLDLLAQKNGHIDKIVYCPHLPESGCGCRKPKPGMLLQIGDYFNTSLQGVPFIGDRITDIKAAKACNARPYLITSKMTESIEPSLLKGLKPYQNLQQVVAELLDSICA